MHLGIIFIANLELGFLHPPLGLNLLLASVRFKKPVLEVTWATLPMLGILARRRAAHHLRAVADAGPAAVAGTGAVKKNAFRFQLPASASRFQQLRDLLPDPRSQMAVTRTENENENEND